MNTIRSKLAIMLMAAFTLVSFLAALNGYRSSMTEAEILMDSNLQLASEILLLNVADTENSVSTRQRGDEFAFQIWANDELVLRSSHAPVAIINERKEGYRYSNFSGYRWRTFTQNSDERWVIVAERADRRHLLAENVVLESILPLLLWLPIAAALVWVLIGMGLRPLRILSHQINLKRSDNLSPIKYPNPPSELVQLIDSTNSLLERLTSSFEREKHFASHAAHEMRTPLSVLKVHLHNLERDLPAGHEGLIHVNSGVERMRHIVEQILDMNRTHPDIMEAKFQRLDLHQLAQEITASVWPEFSKKNQTLSLNGSASHISGDAGLIETLLQNLLDNARKYTPSDGVVEVAVESFEKYVRLTVVDSGPGIPPEKHQQVFERFYRLAPKTANGVSGSGLGLTIVQHIVQLHRAEIHLQNNAEQHGLSIAIDFPKEV